MLQDATGPYIGIAKGVGKSIAGADKAYRRGAQFLTGFLPDEVQSWLKQAPSSVQDALGISDQDPAIGAALEPQGLSQKLGYYGERGVENAVAYINPFRGAIEAGLESGGDPKDIALGAAGGAVGYGLGKAIPATVSGLASVIRNNPEAVSTVADVAGVVHPPLAHGIRLAQRAVKIADRFAPEAAEATATAPSAADAVQGILPAKATAQDAIESILPAEQVPTNANPYQDMNRTLKSNRIAHFLYDNGSGKGIPSSEVSGWSQAEWDVAAEHAGVKKMNAASKKAALDWLQRFENYGKFQRARWAAQDAAAQAAPPIPKPPTPEGL